MPSKVPSHIKSLMINNSDSALHRRILALEAARVFAKWANVELILASTVSLIVGDLTALALIDKFKAKNTQYDAMKTALLSKISCPETSSLLTPLFKLIGKAASPRNKLAHCVWGTIEELPNSLLLTETSAAIKMTRYMLTGNITKTTSLDGDNKTIFEHSFSDENDVASEMIDLLRNGTEVWVHDDFNEPLRLLDCSIVALTHFLTAVAAPSQSPEATLARNELRKILVDTGVI